MGNFPAETSADATDGPEASAGVDPDPVVAERDGRAVLGAGSRSAAGVGYACPSCGHDFAVAAPPADGLVTCPACGAEFFATPELSDEDRAEVERMELDQEVRAQRLVGLKRNVVLLERRSLFRTRSYVIVAMGVCVVAALQLTVYTAQRWVFQGVGLRVSLYLATIGVMLALAWLCLWKIWDLNEEIAKPAQKDPAEPPDFSTLSDGSQVLDAAARNLERLTGG